VEIGSLIRQREILCMQKCVALWALDLINKPPERR
jgi:hypothetical protein